MSKQPILTMSALTEPEILALIECAHGLLEGSKDGGIVFGGDVSTEDQESFMEMLKHLATAKKKLKDMYDAPRTPNGVSSN